MIRILMHSPSGAVRRTAKEMFCSRTSPFCSRLLAGLDVRTSVGSADSYGPAPPGGRLPGCGRFFAGNGSRPSRNRMITSAPLQFQPGASRPTGERETRGPAFLSRRSRPSVCPRIPPSRRFQEHIPGRTPFSRTCMPGCRARLVRHVLLIGHGHFQRIGRSRLPPTKVAFPWTRSFRRFG